MQNMGSLTIFIITVINRETESLNKSYGCGVDCIKQSLSIVRLAAVITLQYEARIEIRPTALDDPYHMLNSSNGSLGQFLLDCNLALLGSLELLLQLFGLLLQNSILPFQDIDTFA